MALQEEFESQGNFLFRYRGNLPLIIVFVGIFVFVFDKLYSVDGSCVPYSVIEYCSLAVSLLGLGIRIYTVGHTPANTSGRNTKQGQLADELNSSGIYSCVRHPLYLGNFFMWLGAALLIANAWFVVVLFLFTGFITRELCMPKNNFCAVSLVRFIPIGQHILRHLFQALSILKDQNTILVSKK